jgi:hypothetical protein
MRIVALPSFEHIEDIPSGDPLGLAGYFSVACPFELTYCNGI